MATMTPGRGLIAWRRNRSLIGGLLPAASLLSLFFVAPAIWAIYTSFTNRALVGLDARHPRHVGWANYERLLHSPAFKTVLINSLVFVVGSAVIGQFLLGLALALLLDHGEHRGYRATPFVYGSVLLAWVNPTVIAGFLWVAMFDFYYGSLNKTLEFFGLSGVSWLGKAPMLSLIIVNTWRGAAFVMIIFQGALRTIPSQIYEAARMDGASAWQRFWDHTLPNLRQVAAVVLLSVTISTFGAFLLILTLTNGGPGTKTEVIALYAYHAAFQSRQIGYGSAIAAIMLGLNLIFAAVYLRVSSPKI
ncbi:MAG TPA: sugar ABC transporter permease [Gemmatimonadaceae bacterium]|jgi:multiple sugar transport system permease protein|nr:sugar ABC transporter permease [Gemmatimonadaceae bacterium]